MARLNYEIEALEKDVAGKREAVEKIEVTMDDVARVIELWTGILPPRCARPSIRSWPIWRTR